MNNQFNHNKKHILLFQPEIPENVGCVMRTCACKGVILHLIEPFGFVFTRFDQSTPAKYRRSVMDYKDKCEYYVYKSWEDFYDLSRINNMLLILLTHHTSLLINNLIYQKGMIFIFGRESVGLPQSIYMVGHVLCKINMEANCRSLNLAMSVALTLGCI